MNVAQRVENRLGMLEGSDSYMHSVKLTNDDLG
jgi:hypothetical protein